MESFQIHNGVTIQVHPGDQCAGEYCVIHNPSDHPYRDLPLTMNERGVMFRIGEDKLYIVDPDSAAFFDIFTLRNSAKCLNCDSHIQSLFHHDFKECKCGEVFVDGGFSYVRQGWTDPETYIDTSIGKEPK
jgi:hypothetical protein